MIKCKVALPIMKNILERFKSVSELTEEIASKLEEILIEIMQSKQQ